MLFMEFENLVQVEEVLGVHRKFKTRGSSNIVQVFNLPQDGELVDFEGDFKVVEVSSVAVNEPADTLQR